MLWWSLSLSMTFSSTLPQHTVRQFCWPNRPILIMCESASCQYHNSPMIDLFLLSGNTTTNNADNGSLQSSSNSKTKMAGGNTVIATGSGTISVTASQQLHTVAKISSNITLGKITEILFLISTMANRLEQILV